MIYFDSHFPLALLVYPKYSFYVFLFGEFIYALWTTTRCLPIHQRTTANPVQVMKGYFMAERTFFGSVIIILAQTMGALIAFFAVVIPVWNNASWLIFWKKDTFNLHAMKMKEPSWAASALIVRTLVKNDLPNIIHFSFTFLMTSILTT
jgi:hypothetical protein